MKRPFGVIFSAIVLILGSLVQLLMALGMGLSGTFFQKGIRSGNLPDSTAATPVLSLMPVLMYAMCVFFIALAVWGIVTAVGVIRLRRWARYSILIIGGLLAVFSLISLLVTLLMMLVPLPMPANVDAAQAHSAQAVTRIMFGVMALVHTTVCAIGVSWLVYFNRRKVRQAFISATGKACESRRPVLISVIAVLNMIGAACCLLCMFIPMPALIFGWTIDGWGKAALYLVFAALTASIGVGLWQLKEWGRLLALAMQALGLVNTAVYLLRPSLVLRYSMEIQQKMMPIQPQPQMPEPFQSSIYRISFGFGILLYIAIAAILIYYRKAFQSSAELSQNEAAPPQ